MLARELDQRYDNVMDPKTVKYSLGNPRSIIAETFGEPGRRTFRLVIESGDARSLSKKIIQAMTMDETSLKLMGKEGRKNIIKKFNVDKMCFSTYTEYKRLLN